MLQKKLDPSEYAAPSVIHMPLKPSAIACEVAAWDTMEETDSIRAMLAWSCPHCIDSRHLDSASLHAMPKEGSAVAAPLITSGTSRARMSANNSVATSDCGTSCTAAPAVNAAVGSIIRHGLEPDVVTYNVIISTCARAQDPDHAEFWLHKLLSKEAGLEPDAVSFCMTVDACVRAGDALRAERWLVRMEEAHLTPSLTCYGTVLHALAKLGDVPRIVRIVERMLEAKMDVNATMYNTLINACAKPANTERAGSG